MIVRLKSLQLLQSNWRSLLGVEIRGMHGVPRMTVLYFPGQNNRTVKDPHQEYDVISVRIHEKYMTKIYDYGFDIALLKLARPAFSVFGKIGTACLPPQCERVPVGKDCYITGRIT